jgi:hypothetical protein
MSLDDADPSRFFLELLLLVVAIGVLLLLVDHSGKGK